MLGDATEVDSSRLETGVHYEAKLLIDESYFGPDVNEYRPERWMKEGDERLDHAAFGMGESSRVSRAR